jgi:hypothetical protein
MTQEKSSRYQDVYQYRIEYKPCVKCEEKVYRCWNEKENHKLVEVGIREIQLYK